jgi:hypothetical protein
VGVVVLSEEMKAQIAEKAKDPAEFCDWLVSEGAKIVEPTRQAFSFDEVMNFFKEVYGLKDLDMPCMMLGSHVQGALEEIWRRTRKGDDAKEVREDLKVLFAVIANGRYVEAYKKGDRLWAKARHHVSWYSYWRPLLHGVLLASVGFYFLRPGFTFMLCFWVAMMVAISVGASFFKVHEPDRYQRERLRIVAGNRFIAADDVRIYIPTSLWLGK